MDKTNRRIVSLLVIGMAFLISACNATTKPATEANMMCVDDAMDVEDAFIAAMADVKSWKIDQGELLLLDATDKSLMKLEPITP